MVFIALGGVQVFKSFDLMTWAKILDVIFKILQNDVIGLFLMMASFELWGNLIAWKIGFWNKQKFKIRFFLAWYS